MEQTISILRKNTKKIIIIECKMDFHIQGFCGNYRFALNNIKVVSER